MFSCGGDEVCRRCGDFSHWYGYGSVLSLPSRICEKSALDSANLNVSGNRSGMTFEIVVIGGLLSAILYGVCCGCTGTTTTGGGS